MKNIAIAALLIITLALTACTKGKSEKPAQSGLMMGTWELIAARGGFNGGNIPISNIYRTYTFNADSTFANNLNKNLGKFHIGQQKSIFDNQMHAYITFSNNDAPEGLITLEKDTLSITANHVEPYTTIYLRIK